MKQSKETAIDDFMEVLRDPVTRIELVRRSHLYFFYTYFAHYVTCDIAPFQKKIFAITEDQRNRLAVIVAFRYSAKSTIVNTSYSLWSILGVQQKKYVLIFNKTQEQARSSFNNIKKALENELLRADLGPFEEDEKRSSTLTFTRYGAMIRVASIEEGVRGYLSGSNRPDVLILDDIESSSTVRTQESRDKTYKWFVEEAIGLGNLTTKIFVIGNKLHDDSLVSRLQNQIISGKRNGLYREYPIITDRGKILWPGMFPNLAAVEDRRLDIGDDFAWNLEYLLKVIDIREPVIQPGWIKQYPTIPEPKSFQSSRVAVGIDVAISLKDTADYTSMVSARINGTGDDKIIYVLPNSINERFEYTDTKKIVKMIANVNGKLATTLFVEEVGVQGWLTKDLTDDGYDAIGVPIRGLDKRARLQMTANLVREGRIVFPEHGCEELLHQILKFGSAAHDDLVDAFTTMILGAIDNETPPQEIGFMDIGNFWDRS